MLAALPPWDATVFLTSPAHYYAQSQLKLSAAHQTLVDRFNPQGPLPEPESSLDRVELLEDSVAYYPAAISLIDGAEREIILDVYLLGGAIGEKLALALKRAKDRGVAVWVTTSRPDQAMGEVAAEIGAQRDLLSRLGIPIKEFPIDHLPQVPKPPLLVIDHAKALISDRQEALVGSANFIDFSDTDHDIMLRVRGPVVAELADILEAPFNPPSTGIPGRPPPDPNAEVRVVRTDIDQQSTKPRLLELIRRARRRIEAAIFEFSDREVADALVEANNRGVAVRVLLDRHAQDAKWVQGIAAAIPHWGIPNFAAAQTLLAGHVPVRWYDPQLPQQEMHLKYALFDAQTALVGSLNWTPSALGTFREINLEYRGTAVDAVSAVFERDWSRRSTIAKPLDLWQRVQAGIITWLDEQGIVYW